MNLPIARMGNIEISKYFNVTHWGLQVDAEHSFSKTKLLNVYDFIDQYVLLLQNRYSGDIRYIYDFLIIPPRFANRAYNFKECEFLKPANNSYYISQEIIGDIILHWIETYSSTKRAQVFLSERNNLILYK